jgi:hypothetical protein
MIDVPVVSESRIWSSTTLDARERPQAPGLHPLVGPIT